MKILLVDDSGTMRAIQKRCLLKMGVAEGDITEAADGQEALEKFDAGTFDAVLTDWNMPVMDGLQLLKELRSRNEEIPIVMITTEAERSRVVTAIQAKVSDYVVKPFTAETLAAKLEKWIPVSV